MNLSKEQRNQIYLMFGGKCAYCGYDLNRGWNVDHKEPLGRQAKSHLLLYPERDILENMVPACQACNNSKGSHPLEVWRKRLENKVFMAARDASFKYALRFNRIIIVKEPLIFWFEKYDRESNALLP